MLSCEDTYIGGYNSKLEYEEDLQEIYKLMFEVDSIIQTIKLEQGMLDTMLND